MGIIVTKQTEATINTVYETLLAVKADQEALQAFTLKRDQDHSIAEAERDIRLSNIESAIVDVQKEQKNILRGIAKLSEQLSIIELEHR